MCLLLISVFAGEKEAATDFSRAHSCQTLRARKIWQTDALGKMYRFSHSVRVQRPGLVQWYGWTVLKLADRQIKWFHHAKLL